jgi:two-component system chemotaxis response regulator CheY
MKVLIVDDSKAMRMIVLRTLRQTGLPIDDVLEAEDGLQALDVVAGFAPDLILSDWKMPNMTGMQFLTELRARGDETRFGFVTAESHPKRKEEAINAGAAFFLGKPLDVERLGEVIRETVA